jgi:LacI family transcriptional regulator
MKSLGGRDRRSRSGREGAAVRMKDIAEDMGLSTVTISKALRGHPDIAEETQRRILKRAAELNYQPNLTARALITGRTGTIGLVVPDLLHPFFAQVAKAISAAIRGQGYSLILASSEEDAELERQEIEQLLARRVDVLLIASAELDAESLRPVEESRTPFILIDRRFAGLTANFVGVDDVGVGRLATEHLISQGCRRIAHIRGPETSTAIGRLQGFRDALAAHKRKAEPDYVVPIGASGDDRGEPGGYEAAMKLLRLKHIPDGVFCFNDPIALGAMRAILEAGLRIPDDVAVVGCGNVLYSDFLRVPLTSIDQDSAGIGKQAAELALELVSAHRPSPSRVHLVTPQLVVRASTKRSKN